MTKDIAPELFKPLGGVRERKTYSPEEIAGMSPERLAAFNALYDAIEGEQAAEKNHRDALDAVKFALAETDRCKIALYKFAPKLTHHDIWLRDVKGIVPQFDPDAGTAEKVREAEIALQTAEENAQHARDAASIASLAIRPARARVATALSGYLARYPVVTGIEATKAVIATGQRQREINKAQGRSPNVNAATPYQSPSVLDAARKNNRGTPGFSPAMGSRGAMPAHMRGVMVTPPKVTSDKP